MSDEEYRQEGINMQLKPINDKIKALEEWKKIEEEQHQNITKALDNFVIDAGAIGDSVYSNKLKSLENEIAESKGQVLAIDQVDAKYKQEISALKEKVNYLEDRYKESGGLRCLRDRGLIKEVLRELHELMRGLVSDLQDSNSLSKATIKCYEGKLIKNLKKLDFPKKHCFEIIGGRFFKKVSDKQAEKKGYQDAKFDLYSRSEDYGLGKDSGGVDVVESSKHTCSFCGRKLILYGQEWICGHGCTKPAIRPDEKLPEFVCSLELQGECGNEGSMDCLKGNSKGERFDNNVCVHGKKELEKPKATPELVNTSEPLYPKVVYQLGSDSREYIELKKKYDKLIEDFVEKLKRMNSIIEYIQEEVESIDWEVSEDLVGLVNQLDGYINNLTTEYQRRVKK